MGTSVLAGVATLLAIAPAFAQEMETVTVTGYRASLASSTNAKRDAVGFTDSVFAEDIGKFPDTNIAEAFNRIPGITISRENDGSGVRVAIRGLDTNHAKVTLNGATVMTASTGNTDAGGANREVDLNIFPIELFTKLTVDKTSRADLMEGGAAGNIDMRSARPFDNPGFHLNYNVQGSDYENNGNIGGRGHLIVSDTEGPFGVLLGASGQWNRVLIKGYEGAFNNVTTLSLNDKQYYTAAQIADLEKKNGVAPGTYPVKDPSLPMDKVTNPYLFTNWCNAPSAISNVTSPGTSSVGTVSTCNPVNGQNGWSLPNVFPNTGVPANYVGQTITPDALIALNPGLNINQIGSAFIPRTGRPMFEKGVRNRYNGILALEYRPTDELHFYMDNILGVSENNLDREDLMFVGRSGNAIPMNMQVAKIDNYGDYAVTSADFANAQMALEARPYKEKSFYLSVNPGMDWQVTDKLHVDANVNYSRSHFFRDSPTFMPSTAPGVIHYDNTGSVPTFSTTLPGGFQNPENYGWYANSRLSVAQERRSQWTKGAHANASYGGDEFKVQAGAAYDETHRLIRGYNNDGLFAEANCQWNPTVYLPGPNKTEGCGPLASMPSSWTQYWNVTDLNGYNYPKSLGLAVPTAQAPLVPSSMVPSFLTTGPNGFARVNYDAFKAATNYNYYATTPSLGAAANLQDPGHTNFSAGTNTNISSSIIDEKTMGFYGEVFGTLHRGEQKVRYNVGFRWVRTLQELTGYTSVTDPRNVWTIDCANPIYAGLRPKDANGVVTCTSGTTTVAAPDGTRYPNYIIPSVAKGSYSAFLPSVNLVWQVLDDLEFRAAASRTMTRANPASMLPQLSGGGSGGDAYSLGNPQLKPYYSTNIDFGANLYTGGEGYIGVGVFRKMLTGFPSNYSYNVKYPWLAQYGTVFAGNAAGSSAYNNLKNLATAGGCWSDAAGSANTLDCVNIQITQARNAAGLETIKGLELNWVQPLDFVLKDYGLEGFGWTANATWVSAKTTPNSAAPAVVLGVSPFTMNLTGYYENNGVMVKLSYNYQRGTITNSNVYGIISAAPYLTSEYSMDFGTVDLSSSVKLSKFFGELPTDPEVTFDIQNLTHALNGRSYKQTPKLMNYSYDGGSLFLLGIRGNL
jgi:TonB-dependent receptor